MKRRRFTPPKYVKKIFDRFVLKPYAQTKRRVQNFLKRRPHRSFRPTDRRDMPKFAPLPSNIFFTAEVFGLMRRNKRAFASFTALYVVLYTLLAGISSQDGYKTLSDSIKDFGPSVVGGEVDKATQTLTLFGAAVMGALNDPLTESQQVYIGFLGIFSWLTIVWYLRHKLAGAHVKIRDALYSGGAPFLSTAILGLVLLVQSVPGALAVIVYMAVVAGGTVTGGIESMMFAIATGLLVLLSLYWMTSTLLAMVIVTIPGTYPMRALSLAGDVVIGRRVTVLIRLLWVFFILLLVWACILVPTILIADALPWDWLPVVPVVLQILTGWSFLFFATYTYLLYRRMIDDPAKS